MIVKILGNLDHKYINNTLIKTKELIKIPKNLTIYFLENLNLCYEIKLPRNFQNRFKTECNQKVSFSVNFKNKNLIIIYVTKELQKNDKALIGLMLHEIMHIIQMGQGIYKNIYSDFNDIYLMNYKLINNLNYDKTRLKQLFNDLSIMIISTLKDIYANDTIIRKKLDLYLIKYYHLEFNRRICPKPMFYEKSNFKKDINIINLVFDYELSLLSIILPLYKVKKAQPLIDVVEDCYESNIRYFSERCHELINLYFTSFNKKDFNKTFINFVFLKIYNILK